MVLSNKEVARRWSYGKSGASGNMSTDGKYIYSYKLLIGFTTNSGKKISLDYSARSGSFYSCTTSRHCSITAGYSDRAICPHEYGVRATRQDCWNGDFYTTIPERLLNNNFDKPESD